MRGARLRLGATVNRTVPLPVPVAPAVMVTHPGAPVTVHAHEPAEASTVNWPEAPIAGTD